MCSAAVCTLVGLSAAGALRRGREGTRSSSGRRRQVPRPAQVPAAAHHLGRRGDVVLLQGEVADGSAPVVRAQPVPVAARQEGPGRADRPDDHPGQQLVQEPTPEGPRRRQQGRQVRVHTASQLAAM